MSTQSSIEWTERTWNPVVGCKKVSQGCKNCYAETMSRRLRAMGVKGYEQDFTTVNLLHGRLLEPTQIRKPSMWFVNSMSDLFQHDVPFDFIDQVFDIIRSTPRHVYQILTKRPERMTDYFESRPTPPQNAWLGTSVENVRQGVPRIEVLRRVPAAVRFLSIEPLLEDLGLIDLTDIHWVIVGGESGPGARPMKSSWASSIRTQCGEQGVAFFFKQWGAYGEDGVRRSKHKNGRLLNGREWSAMPA